MRVIKIQLDNDCFYLARVANSGQIERHVDTLFHLPADGWSGPHGVKVDFPRNEWLGSIPMGSDWRVKRFTTQQADDYLAIANR